MKKLGAKTGRVKAVPAIELRPAVSEAAFNKLANELTEVKGDLMRLVELMAEQWGDPFLKRAKEIIQKHQGQEDF